jgi:enoyl-CoA hydratase
MIELSHRGGIAIVKMIHGKANALDIEFCEALATQFEALRGSDTKAVVLTGQGQMFSAGVNLLRLSEGGARPMCGASCRRCIGFTTRCFSFRSPWWRR